MNNSKFIYGTIILATSSLIVRMLSLSYDITLSRMIGAEAIGLFYLVNPILMMFLMVTTAVSKLVSKAKSRNSNYDITVTVNATILLTLIISFILALILIVTSKHISINIYNNEKLLSLIYVAIPAIPILSLTSVLRGYLYGLNKMAQAGFSEIIEHIGRFIIIIFILFYIHPVSPYTSCKIAIFGISIGEFLDLIYLLSIYKKNTRDTRLAIYSKDSFKSIVLKIIKIATPLTILGFVSVASQSLNTILIPKSLLEAGLSQSQSIETLGRIMGMGMPLVYLPYIVTSALVINIIPNLSNQSHLKNYKDIKINITLSIRITFIITLPTMIVFFIHSHPLSVLLYNDIHATKYIKIMSCGMVFLAIQHIFSGILYGIGKQVRATVHRIIGIAFQLFCIVFLISNPRYGVNGYFIGFILSPIIVFLFDMTVLHRYLRSTFTDFIFFSKIGISILITTILTFLYSNFSTSWNIPINNTTIFTILIYFISYIGLLIFLKANPLDIKV
ncbi:MAG: polysaccharide biosynthesis protein [Firmicutes bacterium]|nr:polysaccharide biosynthesis protein [Bacillota bacterium]